MMDEQSYINGSRAAYTAMLQECLNQLNYDLATVKNPTWILEREAAIAQLRELCERFGDNDWNDNLNLADVIEKHLGRHLWGGAEDEFFGETGGMMEPEKIDLIKKVMAAHIDAERGFINMEMLFGPSFKGSDFYEVVSTALDLTTAAASMFVGDKWQWIHWYIASGYGKKPINAKGREIRTLDDLIWLIDECGKKQPE